MIRRLYVFGNEIAVTENGRLVQDLLDDAEHTSAEAIYLGRVVRVVNGMQAAFVDIGQEKNGFLPLNEGSKTFAGEKLSDGMRIPVQVKKEAHDGKGAFLTRDISLCGRMVLLMPCNRFTGVSSRITADADRRRLKELGQEIAQDRFGLVLRSAALDAEEDIVCEEAEELFAAWQRVKAAAPTAHAPSLLYQPRTLLQTVLDDYQPLGIDEVLTDSPDRIPENLPATECDASVLIRDNIVKQRERALQRRVWLDCGGNLVIDPCEAMTVIDVNTAKNTGKRAQEETILKTNLEAAREIAEQIRLRDLSGIILIDMIDMQTEEERQQVLDALNTALQADRVKTVVHGFTSLGLIEMTRKKTRLPLRQLWTEPCPRCGGCGVIRKEENENHG